MTHINETAIDQNDLKGYTAKKEVKNSCDRLLGNLFQENGPTTARGQLAGTGDKTNSSCVAEQRNLLPRI